MSAHYRENNNKPYMQSLYSSGARRQHCVTCPSTCSCDLGQRSNMDQLLIQEYQLGKVHTFQQLPMGGGNQHGHHIPVHPHK